MTATQEGRDYGVWGVLYGSNFFDVTSSSSGTDLWMARMAEIINSECSRERNSLHFQNDAKDLTWLCTRLVSWSSSFLDAPIDPIMGFTEVLGGRLAEAYRTIFGARYEEQMIFDLHSMFLAHNFVPRTGAWYPLPTRTFFWRTRKLDLIHVTTEGPTPAANALDDEAVMDIYSSLGLQTSGQNHERRKFLAKWRLTVYHCLRSIHLKRDGFALQISAFRDPN